MEYTNHKDDPMDSVFIFGLPSKSRSDESYESLINDVQRAVAKVLSGNVDPKSIFVCLPWDNKTRGLGEELWVQAKIANTDARYSPDISEVKSAIVEVLAPYVLSEVTQCDKFDVDVDLYDPTVGHVTWRNPRLDAA